MIKQEETAKNVEVHKERSLTCACQEVTERIEVKLQLFLTSALYDQMHTSAYLLPGKGAPLPFE